MQTQVEIEHVPSRSTDAFLTAAEVASRFKVEPQTTRLGVTTRGLPAVRLGHGPRSPIRFRLSEVEAWIAEQNAEESIQ